MTIEGAIAQLQELVDNDEIPFWAKPGLQKIMETVEMEREQRIEALQKETPDTWIIGREDGRLTYTHDTEDCLTIVHVGFPYCPYCGKKMKL